MRNVAIVGSGPGGAVSAALLSKKGYNVTVYERENIIGGRSRKINVGKSSFTAGPTFISYLDFLIQELEQVDIKLDQYIKYHKLEHLYDIYINQNKYTITNDINQNALMMKDKFGDEYEKNYINFITDNRRKFKIVEEIFMHPYSKFSSLLGREIFKLAPVLHPFQSLDKQLNNYFPDFEAKTIMQFQSKYLGMAPAKTPSMFSILSYLEHDMGIYYLEGGVYKLIEALFNIAKEGSFNLELNANVSNIKQKNKMATLEVNGEIKEFDYIIMNGDVSMNIVNNNFDIKQRGYDKESLNKKKYSCSTFVYYIDMSEQVDLPMHSIMLSDNYSKYLADIESTKMPINDISGYIYYDKKNNPNGLFCLVPVGNTSLEQKIDSELLFKKVTSLIKKNTGIDISNIINQKVVNTPITWETDYFHYNGANFNLAHNIKQMLYFRPHNFVNQSDNLLLVGGSTHPGSGLPTIFASAKIAVDKIMEENSEI
jgi:phytoene desaturase